MTFPASTTISSPLGAIRLVASEKALLAVELPRSRKKKRTRVRGGAPPSDEATAAMSGFRIPAPDSGGSGHPVLEEAARELEAYFAGDLQTFSVPLAIDPAFEEADVDPADSPGPDARKPGIAGTDFQKQVWRGLLTIPYGESRSYAWLAETIGRPGAYRAVGAANGQNPLAIVVPCHRVIGSDGSLIGYGGGLDAKRWLLDHEAAQADLFV